MQSAPSSYPVFLATILGNAIIVTLGAIISVAVPPMLVFGLESLSCAEKDVSQDKRDAKQRPKREGESPWLPVYVFAVIAAMFGYIGVSLHFGLDSGSVVEGVLRGTTFVVGSSVGVAGTVAMLIWLGKRFT